MPLFYVQLEILLACLLRSHEEWNMASNTADKSGRALLLAGINRAAKSGIVFTFADISLGNPVAVENQSYETKVIYTALPGHPKYEGSQQALYTRVDIEAMFTDNGIAEVQVYASDVSGSSTADVVAALNARYGLGFDENDIVVEAFEDGADSVILKANPLSHGYKGEVVVELVVPVTPLADLVVNPEMGDLEAPVPVEEPAPTV
jgi:hypothetical protein